MRCAYSPCSFPKCYDHCEKNMIHSSLCSFTVSHKSTAKAFEIFILILLLFVCFSFSMPVAAKIGL